MRDIIVIGGSAGAFECVCTVLEQLPGDLPASVFVVVHVPDTNSSLSGVLSRCGKLTVGTAKHGETVERGRVYVAAGGKHLVFNNGSIELQRGPRENRHMPSVDALFRSAARNHRDRVIGVVLSGAMDDGAAGAFAVKARGGVVIVQDPKDARVPDMPNNVIRYLKPDHVLRADEIAPMIVRLVRAGERSPRKAGKGARKQKRVSKTNGAEAHDKPAPIVCPDCGGPLTEKRNGHLLSFECQVGHKFSPDAVSHAHADALERALWVALRHLSERRAIQQTLAAQYHHDRTMVQRYEENAEAASHDIALLREILERL